VTASGEKAIDALRGPVGRDPTYGRHPLRRGIPEDSFSDVLISELVNRRGLPGGVGVGNLPNVRQELGILFEMRRGSEWQRK
jgi:hypothetical protein